MYNFHYFFRGVFFDGYPFYGWNSTNDDFVAVLVIGLVVVVVEEWSTSSTNSVEAGGVAGG